MAEINGGDPNYTYIQWEPILQVPPLHIQGHLLRFGMTGLPQTYPKHQTSGGIPLDV